MSGLCSAKEPSVARLSIGKIILTISVVFNFAKACKIKEGIKRKKEWFLLTLQWTMVSTQSTNLCLALPINTFKTEL